MAVTAPEKVQQNGGQASPGQPVRPPLDRDSLTDVVDLALWTGQLLMENGAESQRVEETVRMIGAGLGCDWGDVFVSHNALMVSHSSGGEFRTKLRRLNQPGVNMDLVAAISSLTHRVMEGKYDRVKVRAELQRISTTQRLYNRWLTALVVGLACAAFSRLFGGDWLVFPVTFAASAVAMLIRQELAHRKFNQYLNVVITAFVAAMLASVAGLIQATPQSTVALAASVILLVPGVPFINAVEDFIKGHTVVGLARGTVGILIILCIALGLILAMHLTGVASLWVGSMSWATIVQNVFWAALAAVGFAVLFNVPGRALVACAAAGAVGYGLRTVCRELGLLNIEGATLVGATAVGFLGVLFGKRWHAPVPVFVVPGVIPLVPGALAFRTMMDVVTLTTIEGAVNQDVLAAATVNGLKTVLIVAAIAFGVAIPSLLLRRYQPMT